MADLMIAVEGDGRRLPKDRAYTYIREQILSGAWPGGTRLQPEQIAQDLGISRMPVRDAITQLDSELLLTVRPHQGAIVTILPAAEILEIYEIRASLEGLAARRAIEKISRSDLAELHLLGERLTRSELDVEKWLAFHDEFHDFVCDIGGVRHLAREIRKVRASLQPYLIMSLRTVNSGVELKGDEHRMLIATLESGNASLAEETFRHHVQAAGKKVADFISHRSAQDRG